jgi:hypothetical protein
MRFVPEGEQAETREEVESPTRIATRSSMRANASIWARPWRERWAGHRSLRHRAGSRCGAPIRPAGRGKASPFAALAALKKIEKGPECPGGILRRQGVPCIPFLSTLRSFGERALTRTSSPRLRRSKVEGQAPPMIAA